MFLAGAAIQTKTAIKKIGLREKQSRLKNYYLKQCIYLPLQKSSKFECSKTKQADI